MVAQAETGCVLGGHPEITVVNYDLWTLRLTLEFVGREAPVYLEFDGVRGFRVLDEGDLTEFWGADVRADGWLWRVERGGWRDQERTRTHFLSCDDDRLLEFLVAGVNDCVSVLAWDEPRTILSESRP